jgi:iron complex outermembrane receptor protein
MHSDIGGPRNNRRLALALLCASIMLGGAGSDDTAPTDIGTVRATGEAGESDLTQPAPGSAPAVAPSQPPLDASQPTSVIGPSYIQNDTVGSENYDNIIKFSPSAQNVEPTGAGLQQNFMQTIRGFRYTQFNQTFDDLVLPGTISSFAPQTGAYFLAHDIESISIDRGPGTASQIGYATFGGTVAATLTSPSPTFGINPYGSFGSWGLNVEGLRLDSGAIPQLGGASGLLDGAHVQGNGYLSGTSTNRNNLYGKIEAPIGDNTVLTVEGMYDYARTHTPYGSTLAQIQTLGPSYSLNQNPLSQAASQYNTDNYYTDFDYIGIKSSFGDGWGIDDKAYTVSYYHNGISGLDPNDTTPAGVPLPGSKGNLSGTYIINGVLTKVTDDVPGLAGHSDFRSVGNTFKLTKDTDYGQIRAGLWVDFNSGSSYKTNVDLSDDNAPYIPGNGKGSTSQPTPYNSLYDTTLLTVQPYLEFAWKPLPGLTITPGLKFISVTREVDATYINKTGLPLNASQTWDHPIPSVDLHYEIIKGWVTYAQVAEGFLAPPLNTLLVPAGNSPTSLKPQTTTNYQVGTTFRNDRFSAGFDMYYIRFQNYIAAETNNLGTIYANNGSAVFKGIEAEATAKIVNGVALYGNATLNDATYAQSGFPVALSPRSTAAIGPILQRDNFFGALLAKYVGPQYTLDQTVNGTAAHPLFPIQGYYDADLSLGYKLVLPQFNNRSLDFRLNITNLFNDHSLTGLFGQASSGAALYATNPGRGVFFSVAAAM